MPSRNEYLQSLNRMRANYQNQGNPLINREDDNGSVGNELSAFAYMNTTPASSAPEQASKRNDFLGKLFGSVDEIAYQFGSGYVNGWEGGLDLGANILGGITKNEDFKKWAQQDLGAEAGRFIQTYANLTPWAIIDNAKKGNYADKDWWGNAISGFGDIMTAGFGGWDANQIVQGILSGGVSTLMALIGTGITELGNSIGGEQRKADAYVDRSFENDKNEKYGFDTSPISDTQTGQFFGGIAHSIGEMLPSIQIGMAVGKGMSGASGLNAMRGKAGIGASAKALKYVPKLASTGMMGLSASGHAMNEALKEGANDTQALGYGLASGAIESATEWIFPDGGVGGVKVGKQALKKSVVREIGKEMLQEGAEEVISELASPIIKMIYDNEAYKEYTTGDYWKQVALAGLGGAISGGIMSGVQNIGNRIKYGKNGSNFLEHSQNLFDLENEYKKAKTVEQKTAIAQQIEVEAREMLTSLKEMVNDKSERGKKQLVGILEQLGMVNSQSNISTESQVQNSVRDLNQEYGNVEAEKNKNVRYTIPTDETQKIMETKLENKDGSAKRYVFLDEPDEFNNRIIAPATNSNEPSFFVYAKKPLREAKLPKSLSFEKMSKKFNIPASLEKTYSKKLANKNPFSVIQFISRYAKTDAKGVLSKLGYDAFEYKDGRVVILDNKQLGAMEGAFKYGKAKGTNDYSSLVKRLGRESADGKLRGYLGQNGKELATKEARQEYAQLVRDNRAYESTTFKNNDIMVVDKAVYTREMLEIEDYNNKIGVKTKFILNDNGKIRRASGFYDNDGTIYLVLNRADPRTLTQRNEHEVFHYLEDVYHVSAISNIDDVYTELARSAPAEFNDYLEYYARAYQDLYDNDEGFNTSIKEEMMAEIYSRDIEFGDNKIQQRFVDTVNKVRDMGQEKAQSLFVKSNESGNYKPVKVKHTLEKGAENDTRTTESTSAEESARQETGSSDSERNRLETKGIRKILKYVKSNSRDTSGLGLVRINGNRYVQNVGGSSFYHYFSQIHKGLSLGKQVIVDLHDEGFYAEGKSLVRYDGKAVAFVLKDGNIVSVANGDMTIKGFTKDALAWAIKNGGTKMDCMNSLKDGAVNLPYAYSKKGFVPVSKVAYSREIMLQDHPKEMVDAFENEFGKSDLIFMAYSGKEAEVYKSIEDCQKAIKKLPYDDWEVAFNKQTQAVANLKPAKIISDIKAKSSNVLIEAGADVSKSVKYRLDSVKSAFETALAQVVPDNGSYKLKFSDTKQSFAELNLARPKDRRTAIDNLIKRLKSTEVTLVDVFGEEKTTLGELLSPSQEQQARDIMLSALNGKAEPTKLARWARALGLQKIKTIETARSFKLMRSIENKIKRGTANYLSTFTDAVGELTLFENVIKEVKLPLTNASVLNLANNIATYYTADNFGKMLTDYGVPYNSDVYDRALDLKSSIQRGRPLTAQQITEANDILQLIKNDLTELEKAGVANKRTKARDGAVLAQAQERAGKSGLATKITNLGRAYYLNVASPVNQFETYWGENHPATVHLRDTANEAGNQKISDIEMLKANFYGDKKGEQSIRNKAKTAKKINLKGYKITVANALKIINTEMTANAEYQDVEWDKRPFYKRGGAMTVGAKRVDIDFTPQDIENLKKQIPQEFLDFNEQVKKGFKENGKYLSKKYKELNHVPLEMVEDYYPTSAVGDKAPDIANAMKGSISPRDWGIAFMQKRVRQTNARYNLDGDIFRDINNQIETLTNWANYAPWYREWTTILNSSPFGKGSSLFAIGSRSIYGFKELVDFINKTALGIPYIQNTSLLSKADNTIGGVFGNLNAVAMSGLFTQLKTWGSYFTGWQFFTPRDVLAGYAEFARHGGEIVADKYARKVINENSPMLKARGESSEAFSANVGKRVKTKAGYYITTVVRTSDRLIHDKAFYTCLAKVKADPQYKGLSEAEYERKAVKLLEQYSEKTQPTTAKFNVGMYRSGYKGQIIKQFAGMFQSMGQNIFQGLIDVSAKFVQGNRRVKGFKAGIESNQLKADQYAQLEKDALARMNNAMTDEEYDRAEKDYEEAKFHREGHEKSRDTLAQALEQEKGKWTGKRWVKKSSTYLAGLVGSGIVLTLIAMLRKIFTGKKDPKEITGEEFVADTAYQAFVNWIPIFGQIANAIKNDQDLSVFTLSNVNDALDTFKVLAKAISEGDLGHIAGSTFNSLMYLAKFFGVPASSIWELVNGAWYHIDRKSNLSFSEAMGFMSATKLRNNYHDAMNAGAKDRAIANLDVWAYNNSIKTSDNVLEEIYRLNRVGETGVAPSAIPTKYTNENGDEIKLTSAQINAFKREYAKADKDVSKLLKIEDYRKQDDKTKASLMRRLYSAYRESAQAKALGITPNSKLGKLLFYTNGDVNMAKYIMSLQKLSVITEDKKHTRKENVISAINKMAGFSRQEKLLLAYLSGYNVSEKNQQSMIRFLMSKGFDKKSAKTYLGLDK